MRHDAALFLQGLISGACLTIGVQQWIKLRAASLKRLRS